VVTRVGPLLSSFKSLQENNPAKKMEKAANGMSFKNFKNRKLKLCKCNPTMERKLVIGIFIFKLIQPLIRMK
jgi:hypothetical protein